MSVIRKNKLSDLAASVAMPKGYSANDYDFELRFFTTPESGYIVSKMGDVLTNCSIGEDGLIYARLDKHHLPVGRLRYEIGVYTPNAAWADGAKIAADAGTTNYILWDGPDDADADNVALAIPYAIVDAYAIAVSQGYQGTQSEFYEALNAMPESVASATVAANDAQSAAQSAEAAASSALIATQDAVAATQAAKNATKDAEASAELATEAAASAELATQEARSVVEPAHEAAALATKAAQSAEATNAKIATAEQSRVAAENARVTAEQQRADAEAARQSAEASRVDAEQSRVEAEKQREADVAKLVSDADATIATNTAKANEAIQTQIDLASKGKPNGIASLDSEGKVLAEQLPEIGGNWESEKGQPNGLATLDNMGTLTEAQERFSEYDYYKNIAYAGKQGTGLIICKTNKGETISRSVAGWNLVSQLGSTLYTLQYIYALPTKPVADMSWKFGSDVALRRINLDGLDFSGTTSMTAFFPQSGGALFDIGKPLANSLKVSVSIASHPLLTPTCIANIIDWLYDFSVENDGSATLTLHKSVKARLSSKQIQTIVNKGWTLA